MRFGVHPITTRHVDLWHGVARLREILQTGRWRAAEFKGRTI